ncbi:MAG: acyl carrier protein [Ruminococcus sp.]|nr:acyl carrier protein [Ruminococcus sp.]
MEQNNAKLNMQLKKLILENAVIIEDNLINDNTDLILDLGFDSFSIIQLIADIESEFNIEIEDEYLVTNVISKFGKLRDCIKQHLNTGTEEQFFNGAVKHD